MTAGSEHTYGAPGRIRVAEPGDCAQIAAIYAPIVRDTWISFETEPPSPEDFAGRIARILPHLPWLVMADGDDILGYVHASPHSDRAAYRWSVHTTVYLQEDARGQGVGKRLYLALLDILRRQGLKNAFAGIALPNDASVALHRSLGFQPFGAYENVGFKLGAWRSVLWSRLQLAEQDGAPAEPTPFASLRDDPDFRL